MMMIGEGNHHNHHHHHNQNHPTVHVPPWSSLFDESTAEMTTTMGYPLPVSGISSSPNASPGGAGGGSGDYSPFLLSEALTALQRYLPSNEIMADSVAEDGMPVRESDIPVDTYSCDEFRMYEFKVRRCARGRSHDWTECPYAHPGEKARRRDPRKFHYSGTACPDFRKGNCKRGDTCEYAHGVFECWLHPARYRTQPCKDGTSCRRRVCFFAHTPEQLRVLPQQSPRGGGASESPPSYDGSPLRHALDSYFANGGAGGGGSCMLSSPTSTLMIPAPISPSDESEYSPPMSPTPSPLSRSLGSSSINEMVVSLRNLQLNKVKSAPSSWGVQVGGSGFCSSPRGVSSLRPDFNSLPSTPTCTRSTATPTRSGGGGGVGGYLDFWDRCGSVEEEPVLERVESGRNLRAKIFEKLREENSLERGEQNGNQGGGPDVGWVSELVK